MSHLVRVLEPGELRAAHTLFAAAIHRGPVDDERWAALATTYAPGRTLGVDVEGALVATATSFPSRTAVPGGAALPTAAVTRVGVRADSTRRGMLTALMEAQLDAAAGAGEALASLRASEARIYGRFGYGVATRGRAVRLRRDGAGFRRGAPGGGSVRLLDRDEIVPVLAAVYGAIAPRRPGAIGRPDAWWAVELERRLATREHLLAAVHTGADGDDGFVVASSGHAGAEPGAVLQVGDLHAADVAATAGLWRFLLGVDLVRAVEGYLRPLDEPLELLLADPRDCATTAQEDETWLRIVDVPAALAARGWGAAARVRLAVRDALLPANAGVYRLADGTAERVGPPGAGADLECDVAGLAMAYLGDRRPSELAAAGWWAAPDPAALPRADALFAVSGPPWCGTYF